jgi:type II secretory pathway component GspD/PulD (secretin)
MHPAPAADPAFVGSLSLVVEKEVADHLSVTEEVRAKLQQLVSVREAEALKLLASMKDVPATEQAARLLPFVVESERLGLALLTVSQREKLQQIRLAREGLAAVTEPGVAGALGLSAEQQKSLQEVVGQRAADLLKGSENERRLTRALYERKLAGVLSEKQRAAWDKLAGLTAPPANAAPKTAPAPSSKPEATPDMAAPAKPDATTPGKPETAAPVKPDTTAPVRPETTTPVKSDTTATVRPETTTPVKPDATAKPETAAPVKPDATAPAKTDSTDKPQAAPGETYKSQPSAREVPPANTPLRLNFEAAPWKEVLNWMAQQAGLSLAADVIPVGSFTYHDDRTFTVDEALDLMNSCLLPKGYTLVRRERMLQVFDLETPVQEELVPLVTIEELGQRGRFELVKCLFPLARLKAEDVATMIKDFIGPQGKAIPFAKTRQILVTETAGKLRTISEMIERAEDPEAGRTGGICEIELKHATAEEFLAIARPLLGIADSRNASTDVTLSVDLLSSRIFASGNPEKIQLLRDLVPKIDKPAEQTGQKTKEPEQPKLATYQIKAADPQLVLRLVQTLLADLPGVRVEVDATSGKLVALARPSEHRVIEEAIRQLEGQSLQFAVIPLRRTEPSLAVAAINKFFALGSTGDPKKDAAKQATNPGPIVDGDTAGMKLWVRGTAIQIEQIQDLVEKLEGGSEAEGATGGGTIRTIPLPYSGASQALETALQMWSRQNRIRVVTPAAKPSSDIRLRVVTPLDEDDEETPREGKPPKELVAPPSKMPPGPPPASKSAGAAVPGFQVRFASQLLPAEEPAGDETPAVAAKPEAPQKPAAAGKPAAREKPASPPSQSGAEIRVAITPNGIVLMSEDTQALDEFEKLLRSASSSTAAPPARELTVFYLKFAKADVAHKLVTEVLAARPSDAGGALLGDMTSGGLSAGLLGARAGASGLAKPSTVGEASSSVMIIPDPRMNALIVEGTAEDLAFVEQLLRVIDRETGETEVQTAGVPHVIPIVHSTADQVATVVRQVFANQIAVAATAAGGAGGVPGMPGFTGMPMGMGFFRGMRGGEGGGPGQPGGGRQDQRAQRGEEPKMTIGVDQQNNAIVVTAPEPLFRQVEALVQQIDKPGSEDADVVTVMPIKGADTMVMQRTLASILGRTGAPGTTIGTVPGMGTMGRSGFPRTGMQSGFRGTGGFQPGGGTFGQGQQGPGGGRSGMGGGRSGMGGGRSGMGGGMPSMGGGMRSGGGMPGTSGMGGGGRSSGGRGSRGR